MANLINNKQALPIFTMHPTSVDYKGKRVQLSFADKCKIFAACFFGSFFFGIGGPIAGMYTSYVLRNRKIEQLERQTQADDQILLAEEGDKATDNAEASPIFRSAVINESVRYIPQYHKLLADEEMERESRMYIDQYKTLVSGSFGDFDSVETEFGDEEGDLQVKIEPSRPNVSLRQEPTSRTDKQFFKNLYDLDSDYEDAYLTTLLT